MCNHLYEVIFEQIFKPGEDLKEVKDLCIHVFASSVTEAIEKAWKTVTIPASDYEIVTVSNRNSMHPRGYYRDD